MSSFRFSDNIIKFRHKKKITQEQLADFIGVTKASVSKWETGQSLPDILLLPELASFFDITIDELLGYEPQLIKEQIRRIYRDLATAFANMPFTEVMEQSREYVKKYYSCYPFLFQMGVLWLNHFMLAESEEQGIEVLKEISSLCNHIIENCKDIGICEDAVILKASVDLQIGKAKEAVAVLEEIVNPCRLSKQSDTMLINAYLSIGKKQEADSFAQISMFLHLLNFIADASFYLIVHNDNLELCKETIFRILEVEKIYKIDFLHPNQMAVFYYKAAIVFCTHKEKQQALKLLKRFAANVTYLLTDDHLTIHGDNYFHRIQEWYERLELGVDAPRDKKTVFDSLAQVFSHPAFAILEEESEYQHIKKSLMKIERKLN